MDKKITKASFIALIPALAFFVNAEQENIAPVEQQPVIEQASEPTSSGAEDSTNKQTEAGSTITSVSPYDMYVTEKLFIFVHSGSSNKYRIIGRIAASEQVKVIAKDTETGWLQVNYDKTKTGWVDSSMITSSAGTAAELAATKQKVNELNKVISELKAQPDVDIDEINQQITQLKNDNQALLTQLKNATSKNTELEASIQQVDETRKILDKLYDVGVILIGIFVGWLLSRRKRGGISFNHL